MLVTSMPAAVSPSMQAAASSGELKRPPKVDVVVSETLGNYALEEGLLETLADARRYLKKNGVLIPCALQQWVAPVLDARLQDEIDIWPQVGFGIDLAEARTVSLNNMYVRRVVAADLGGDESLAKSWDELRFTASDEPAPSLRRRSLHWSAKQLEGRRVYGWALWWVCELVPGIAISTAPLATATHWDQVYLPLLTPQTAGDSEALELTLTSDTRPEAGLRVGWRTRRLREGKALHTQDQDIARGRI